MCRFSCWGPSLCLLLRVAVLWEERGCREAIRHRGWKVWLQPQKKYWIMSVSSTSPQRGESYHTQPCYWQVTWLGQVDCLDSSAVNRGENISRMGFVSSWGGWIGKEEWLIFWVCTSVFIHYGGSLVMSYHKVQPCELHETSHTQSTCGKPGLTGGGGALQQPYSENSKNSVCSHIWRQISRLLCSAYLSRVRARRRCWRWASSKKWYLPNHTSGLVERNLAV